MKGVECGLVLDWKGMARLVSMVWSQRCEDQAPGVRGEQLKAAL